MQAQIPFGRAPTRLLAAPPVPARAMGTDAAVLFVKVWGLATALLLMWVG